MAGRVATPQDTYARKGSVEDIMAMSEEDRKKFQEAELLVDPQTSEYFVIVDNVRYDMQSQSSDGVDNEGLS
mgnify:CR=1 FL=1